MLYSRPRLKASLKFLDLSFEGVDTPGKVLPALLVPLAQPCGPAGTHQGDDRKNNEGNKSQPQHYAEKFQGSFHKCHSE